MIALYFTVVILVTNSDLGTCINKYVVGDYREAKSCAYQVYKESSDPIEKGKALICVAASQFEIDKGNIEELCEIYRLVRAIGEDIGVDPVYSKEFKQVWEEELPNICTNNVPVQPSQTTSSTAKNSYSTIDFGILTMASIAKGPGYSFGKSWINLKEFENGFSISAQSNLLLFSNHVDEALSVGGNVGIILGHNFYVEDYEFQGGVGLNTFVFWMPGERVYFKPLNLSISIVSPECVSWGQVDMDIGIHLIMGKINREVYSSFNSILVKLSFH